MSFAEATVTPRLIDLPEVMHRTSMCKSVVYQHIRTGEFTPYKNGRKTVFSEKQINDWIIAKINSVR